MSSRTKKLISVIVPIFNEEKNIPLFYRALSEVWKKKLASKYDYELIFVDDGSRDGSEDAVYGLAARSRRVKYIGFSRNFGKEIATSAGMHHARGSAAIMLDADLQHPIDLIPEFISKWEEGNDMVIGVRVSEKGKKMSRKIGSKLFYQIINHMGDIQIVPNSTDYRLIDRQVIDEFNRFTERNRITRGLLDWLGFQKDYIYFTADERKYGKPGYSKMKLLKLAMSTFVSHSLFPLKLAGYLGIFIILTSGALGVFVVIEKYIADDPWNLRISGSAQLAVINLFLIGIVLSCLGLIALYIGSIYSEVTNRPMYIIRNRKN